MVNSNCSLLHQYISRFHPHAILFGNLDMLGHQLLHIAANCGIPSFHHHGFSQAAFMQADLPPSKIYHPVANSYYSAREMTNQLPKYSPIDVIYPGAQTHLFSDLQPIPLGNVLKIGFAGLLIGAKGAHILIEALAKLKQVGIPFECQIAGGTLTRDYPRHLIRLCRSLNLLDDVLFLGKIDRYRLRQFYIDNPIFVFPSTWQEPFGITQVEALAAGCLVVTSATGGASETVFDDINGRRFEPSNSDHLAQIFIEIYQNITFHEGLRLKGRQMVQRKFDTARESHKFSQLIINHVKSHNELIC